MSRRRSGQPMARQEACRQAYLQLGPGRSLEKLLAYLQQRAQRESRPSPCNRLATLKRWCSEQNWVRDAIEYDAREAVKRAEYLDQQQRTQIEEDVKTLATVIRGMVALSGVILNTYLGQDGTLQRQADVRDAATLVRVALAGVPLIHAPGQAGGPTAHDLERILRAGSEGQRARAVAALRQLQDLMREISEG